MKRTSCFLTSCFSVFLIMVFATVVSFSGCQTKGDNSESKPDKNDEFCPQGPNPNGEGCFLPCQAGWHETATGECEVDCPPMAVATEDGTCEIQSCPDGWQLESIDWIDGIGKIDAVNYCAKDCPQGMEKDIAGNCIIPCGDGWFKGEDGLCHLQCPNGMISKDGGKSCTLENVGENKTCPEGLWDDSIIGPNPIYVSQKTGSAEGNGTRDSPFIRINQAIAAMGDSATIYVAAGEYVEKVFVKSKKEFHLIGACAERVKIDAKEIPKEDLNLPTEGAVQADDVDIVRVHGVTVSSLQHGIKIRHDGEVGIPKSLQVDQTVVEKAGIAGIGTMGTYELMLIENNSVFQEQTGILCLPGLEEDTDVFGEQIIRRNLIKEGIVPDKNPEGRQGITAMQAVKAVITENIVADFSSIVFTGIFVPLCLDVYIERNIVDGINCTAAIRSLDNVRPNINHNLLLNLGIYNCEDCEAVPSGAIVINNRFKQDGHEYQATVDGNRIYDFVGYGVLLTASESISSELKILNNDFARGTAGVQLFAALTPNSTSGAIQIKSNRFASIWSSISFDLSKDSLVKEISIEDNSFTQNASDHYGVPDGNTGYEFLTPDTVRITMYKSTPTVKVSGNTFFENRITDRMSIQQLSVLGEVDLSVLNNSFTNNDGMGLATQSNNATISGNYFDNIPSAIALAMPLDIEVDSILMTENYFLFADAIITAANPYNTLDIKNNSFIFSYLMTGLDQISAVPSKWNARELTLEKNAFLASRVENGFFEVASITNNLFKYSSLKLSKSQNKEAKSMISGNSLEESGLKMIDLIGPMTIENNSICGNHADGFGIGVWESPGPITIDHNIVCDIEAKHFQAVGEVGDGIHVVSDKHGDSSNVSITGNIIRDNDRLGIILHGSSGFVEGNMYENNGCGASCDVVVQEPGQAGVTGRDIGEPETRDKNNGVILPEDAREDVEQTR